MATILIADDDKATRDVLIDLLNDAGYHDVEVATNGEQTLERLRAHADRLVVLLDIVMPQDGEQAIRAIIADPALASRHTYILMTASDPARLPAYAQALAAPVVFKPFEFETLLVVVDGAVRQATS
jgi:CheY-like chemotaxis protein